MIASLMLCLCALFLAFCPCRAADKARPEILNPFLQEKLSIQRVFNNVYLDCLQKGRVDYNCVTHLTPADYARGVGLARLAPRPLDEKLFDTLNPLRAYPGGTFICDAAMTGMEFYAFSQAITTYGNRFIRTGYNFKNTAGSSVKTGFYLNF
ncbi:hypothetical protein LLH00_11410 [bacterium]|nr:hypothetical protein [bacterium]